MSESTYTSSVKRIVGSEQRVYAVLSDLNNLSRLRERLEAADAAQLLSASVPEDKQDALNQLREKIKDLQIDGDSLRFTVEPMGQMGLRIVDREPCKTIKFEGENTPIPLHFWIQLKQVDEDDTRMKLTLKADVPMMIKMMIGRKLEEGIERMADMLSTLPYDKI